MRAGWLEVAQHEVEGALPLVEEHAHREPNRAQEERDPKWRKGYLDDDSTRIILTTIHITILRSLQIASY